MLALRIALGLALAYVVLVILAWRFQERLAFPTPRAPLPDPKRVGVAEGETIDLTTEDGTRPGGWYLASTILHQPPQPSQAAAGLLWFYGHGATGAAIWTNVREFQPPRHADRLGPTAMGRAVAAAAAGPVELVLIHGAGHNETYDRGGRAYREKIWEFVARPGGRGR